MVYLLKDLLNINNKELKRNNFDFVFSLSCLDWNNNYLKMLNKSWDYVTDGGFLIVTLFTNRFKRASIILVNLINT